MSLCQLYLQTESAYSIVSILGELGICQFRDLNEGRNAFQRKFVNELRRCVQMEAKLSFFEKEIEHDEIPILDYAEEPAAPSIRDITRLESQLDKLEKDLINANTNQVNLKRRLLELIELRSILKHSDQFFAEAQAQDQPEANKKMMRRMSVVDPNLMRRFSMQISQASDGSQDINIPLDPVVDMFTLTGTILASRFPSFERILWRVSRGNILLKKFDIEQKLEDPETGELQSKVLFILVFQGDKLRQTCNKICDGYHTNLYHCPEKADERRKMYGGVMGQINDMMTVIEQSDDYRSRILVAASKNLKQWKVSVAKMKSIYEVLNCFLVTDHSLIGECWVANTRIPQAQMALVEGQAISNSTVPSGLSVVATNEMPPTYNVTNKLTAGFQMIIDSYGVSAYGEVNPAPYSIITFPFIFAVMFGDTGHGIIMALFALWMIFKERQLASIKDEIFSMFFAGRYIILFMGMFSIYTGMIYNDIFSKAINLFGSEFRSPDPIECSDCFKREHYQLDPQNDTFGDFTYYFGIDPIWQLAENKVIYLNTYKMKISVILGVLQMLFGVALSIFNHIHFGKWISVFFEFIPQVIFMLAIFGYMNFMIVYKWIMYDSSTSGCAPSILITLINMFMFRQPVEGDPCYLYDPMYENQMLVQTILILLAVACIPLMLIVKPVFNHCCSRRTRTSKVLSEDLEMEVKNHANGGESQRKSIASGSSEEAVGHTGLDSKAAGPSSSSSQPSPDPHGDESGFGDAFINQAIHTIEYCLGSVSHTASYLRLWALSLAHAQLSEVLWSMVMRMGFMEFHEGQPGVMNIASAVVMFFIFAIWAVLTVSILIVMEGLSAFLHALRLHWVEFMSKFYSGSGVAFTPFSFKQIISEL
ncbi:hypothetical protein RDWZM_008825 [Blomia tropicalis]|uniref:V-type proton ATPase subunit a n=1 Tax=Blomia tropicalis TaxID=40697 RepID=A0A9Q0M077_BLOTA|nr:hypothetical protein RDWZM_008825 [Blomia tropicalis]